MKVVCCIWCIGGVTTVWNDCLDCLTTSPTGTLQRTEQVWKDCGWPAEQLYISVKWRTDLSNCGLLSHAKQNVCDYFKSRLTCNVSPLVPCITRELVVIRSQNVMGILNEIETNSTCTKGPGISRAIMIVYSANRRASKYSFGAQFKWIHRRITNCGSVLKCNHLTLDYKTELYYLYFVV